VIGLSFAMEGFAFFLEAICIGLYLYGWQRLRPRVHLFAGIGVLLGVTLIVLGCFARFFIALARKSRTSAHLVEPRLERAAD